MRVCVCVYLIYILKLERNSKINFMHLCYVLTFFATCSFDIFVSMVCVSEHGHDRWCTNVHSPVHSSTCRSVLFGIAACWEHVALRLCWRAQRAAAPSPWAPRPMPWWCGDCATRPPPPPFRVKKEEKRGRKRRTEVNMFCKKRKHIKWRQHSRGMSDAGLSGWNMKGVRSVNLWSVTWWMQVEARSVTKIWNRKRRGYVQNNVAEKMTSCGHGTKVTVDSNLLISPIYSAPIWGRRRFTVQNAIMWKGQLTNDSKAAGSFGSADWPPGLVCKPLKSWINNIYDLSIHWCGVWDAATNAPFHSLNSSTSRRVSLRGASWLWARAKEATADRFSSRLAMFELFEMFELICSIQVWPRSSLTLIDPHYVSLPFPSADFATVPTIAFL